MNIIEKMAKAHYEKYFEEVADLHLKWHDQPESHLERLYEAVRAALAAAEAAGWVMAPKEPTEEMADASATAITGRTREWARQAAKSEKFDCYVADGIDSWRAMIAARPSISEDK